MKVTKLYNGFIYTHAMFSAAFAEYFMQNGFELKEIWNQLHFTKGSLKLVVMNDNMDVFQHDHLEEDKSQQWKFSHQLEGFSKMDIAQFIYTMDVSLIVPMGEYVQNASRIDKQLGVEAQLVMSAVLRSKFFKNKGLPVC